MKNEYYKISKLNKDEILDEMPEVDAVIGIGANGDIVDIVTKTIEGESTAVFPPVCELPLDSQRILTTPSYWAYIKIAEGCSNCCTYCKIPSIRGAMRSRTIESIVEEARQLAELGVKELIVIAQDTTAYGIDIYGEYKLPQLLKELCGIDGIECKHPSANEEQSEMLMEYADKYGLIVTEGSDIHSPYQVRDYSRYYKP